MKPMLFLVALAAVAFAGEARAEAPARPLVSVPLPDAERGKFLFATRGCVVCHAVNGVGGTVAPALDAPVEQDIAAPPAIEPLAFAARMWRGAQAMLLLQELELGYQIDLSAEDLADLAAFAADRELQAAFSRQDIPQVIWGWTVDHEHEFENGLELQLEGESDL